MFSSGPLFPSDLCVPDVEAFVSQRIPDSDGGMTPLSKKKGWRKRGRMDAKGPSSKGEPVVLSHKITISSQPAPRNLIGGNVEIKHFIYLLFHVTFSAYFVFSL